MKKSEYLEKYGFDIPFTEKELSLVGKDLEFCEGENDKIVMQGIVTDLKFGESTFIKEDRKYLTVSFAIGEWWSIEFPTEILTPFIYNEYTENLITESQLKIKNES